MEKCFSLKLRSVQAGTERRGLLGGSGFNLTSGLALRTNFRPETPTALLTGLETAVLSFLHVSLRTCRALTTSSYRHHCVSVLHVKSDLPTAAGVRPPASGVGAVTGNITSKSDSDAVHANGSCSRCRSPQYHERCECSAALKEKQLRTASLPSFFERNSVFRADFHDGTCLVDQFVQFVVYFCTHREDARVDGLSRDSTGDVYHEHGSCFLLRVFA